MAKAATVNPLTLVVHFDTGLRTNVRRAYTEFQASFIEDHSNYTVF